MKVREQREQKRIFSVTKDKTKARTSISNMSQETCRSKKLPMTFSGVLTSG